MEAETNASQLLALSPESLGGLTAEQQTSLATVRPLVPFIREADFTRHIDARELLRWYGQQLEEARLEGHGRMQAAAEIGRTLETMFPAEPRDFLPLENRLERIAQAQTRHAESPRLHVIGVGGEGAVFVDAGGRGAYKLHRGGAEDAAMGVGSLRSTTEHSPVCVELVRVPLTETIRRYCRQSLLPIGCPTEIKGVTENGRLVTRQPLLDADHATTDEEITRMIQSVGGRRLHVAGPGKELQHCYVVPDGSGNWLLAVDLKPANVLRDKASGEPRLTDGIITQLTPEMISRNFPLAEYRPTRPGEQF